MTLKNLNLYGKDFQSKVIGALLTQREFLINIYDALDAEYFESTTHQWIINKMIEYFKQYHTNLSLEILSIEVKKVENEVLRLAIVESLKDIYKTTQNINDFDWVQNEFTSFCKNQQMKKAIMNSVDLLNMGDYDGIRNLVNGALKIGEDKNIGHLYEKDIEQRYREDDRNPIPFPWEELNKITDGGMGIGELTLIFSGNKMGKSWLSVAIAGNAILLGYNVAYYTLELSETYVGKRIDSYLTRIPVNQIKNHRDIVNNKITKIKGKLIVKSFPAGRVSLNSIENHIDKLKNQNDFIPDLVIIDYLDLLKNKNKNRNSQHEDEADIYTECRGLAVEKKIPIVSPSQMGRGSTNDNTNDPSKIAGSYKKLMIADFSIGLTRTKNDKLNNTGTVTIMGNRNGPDGISYNINMDTSNGHVEFVGEYIEDENKGDFNNLNDDNKKHLNEKFKQFSKK